ncbi:MAG: DUF2510 domain-containing protein, partial [Propionibacteriaceae bacterium]|nr:DUF2510 domain-containing protein [Propionibacteriaceae bacterium]
MPQPGWYADPDGTPQRLRWWDGAGWTDHVHGNEPPPEPGRRSPSKGPWPWIGLALALGLVGIVLFGLANGLFGPNRVVAPTEAEPPASEASGAGVPTLPPVSPSAASTSGSVPTPFPSPSVASAAPSPSADPDCPDWDDSQTHLTDGRLELALPAGWRGVEGVSWLHCSQSATDEDTTATISIGVSDSPASDLEQAAE